MKTAMGRKGMRAMRQFSIVSIGRAVALAATMGVLMVGCLSSSPPPELYTLDMRYSGTPEPPIDITVGLISVAEPLMQKNILIKKSPTQVEYYAVGQWAGSLDEMLREKLETEFGPTSATTRTLVLTGELLAFEQVDLPEGAQAHLKLEAEIRETNKSRYTEALLKKLYDISVPTESADPNGIALALSRAVEQLAAQIAADAASL